jgi:hypothetical protein
MAPPEQWGKTFSETGIRAKYGVTIVGVKRMGEDFVYAVPETLVEQHDELVVSGPTKRVEHYCALAKPKLPRPRGGLVGARRRGVAWVTLPRNRLGMCPGPLPASSSHAPALR